MNQRARHAFVSFTRSDDRERETIAGMRETNGATDLQDRKTDAGKERESELKGKSEGEK